MKKNKKIVIIGASSSIAEHCARYWVQGEAIDLTLVVRDLSRIERIAEDLKVRSPSSSIHMMQADFFDPVAIESTVDTIAMQGTVDTVLIAHGSLPQQTECQNNLQACREAIEINALSPVLYAEAFAKHMAAANKGTLALIGSVAGDRGRKSNYIYGASKGLINRYTQGLQHRFAGTGVKVILIKPGPTDTPMTAHLKKQGAKLASVESVAKNMVRQIDAEKVVAELYLPAKWRLIMLVIKNLPAVVFNKINI